MNIHVALPKFSSLQPVNGPQSKASNTPISAEDSFTPKFRGEDPELSLSDDAKSDLEALEARTDGPLAALFKEVTEEEQK